MKQVVCKCERISHGPYIILYHQNGPYIILVPVNIEVWLPFKFYGVLDVRVPYSFPVVKRVVVNIRLIVFQTRDVIDDPLNVTNSAFHSLKRT